MTQVEKYEQKRTQKYFEPSNKKFNSLRENNPTLGDNGMLQGPQKWITQIFIPNQAV